MPFFSNIFRFSKFSNHLKDIFSDRKIFTLSCELDSNFLQVAVTYFVAAKMREASEHVCCRRFVLSGGLIIDLASLEDFGRILNCHISKQDSRS